MNIILFSNLERCENNFFFYKTDVRYLHIKKILKLSVGDEFKAGIINGMIGVGRILEFTSEKIVFSFIEQTKPDNLFPVHLILGFPRPIQLRRILRDVVSLGVSEISLVGTELGEKSYLNSTLASKDSLNKILIDGCSQAGSTMLPKIDIYKSVNQFFEKVKLSNKSFNILFDIEEDCASVQKVFNKGFSNQPVFISIGSERGWTKNERDVFAKNNFTKCSLGKRILRTETAVTTGVSVVLNCFGFWE